MKYVKNWKFYLLIAIVISIGSTNVYSEETLLFSPICEYSKTPSFLNGWFEDYDLSDLQNYCIYNNSIYIYQDTYKNFRGQLFTKVNADFWTTVNYEQKTGNIRNVYIQFDYYVPSHHLKGCIQKEKNIATNYYNIPQMVLITNKESNLSIEGTFDDAFYQFNSEIICDEWLTFNHSVSEFTNDFGSSFSGQSKSIGSIGFESKLIYIKNIKIDGVEKVQIW